MSHDIDHPPTITRYPPPTTGLIMEARRDRDRLLDAIAESLMWDPRRAGFAAALSRLMSVADEIRSKATPA